MKEKRKNKTSFKKERSMLFHFTACRDRLTPYLNCTKETEERGFEVRERGREGRSGRELEEREQCNARHYQAKPGNFFFYFG